MVTDYLNDEIPILKSSISVQIQNFWLVLAASTLTFSSVWCFDRALVWIIHTRAVTFYRV
jgi:hypothetical protein